MAYTNKNDRAAWIQGPSAHCEPAANPWRLIVLGAPGVGKGTQADLLHQRLRACHLTTGDVFRTAGKQNDRDLSPAMPAALGYMRRGELVPDSTVWDMVRERCACLRCVVASCSTAFPAH
jgi:adenylate kinase